jgi:hypothetical protein
MPIEEQAAADLRQLEALADAVITAAQQRTGRVDALTKRHSELYEAIRTKLATDAAYSKAYRQAWSARSPR